MEYEITDSGPLLNPDGTLATVGWSRQMYLDCNLEALRFLPFRSLQFLRTKRWDYYAFFSPTHFFSATIANLGYAGNIFVYIYDYASGNLHEEGIVVPLGRGIELPRNSNQGISRYAGPQLELSFDVRTNQRIVQVDWPDFHSGRGVKAQMTIECPAEHESMNIVIPFSQRRFYFNRKINCLPVEGNVTYGADQIQFSASDSSSSLDWGCGIWPYRSTWIWASSSGFLPDGRRLGLNLGGGFGDTSRASENCVLVEGRLHKIGPLKIDFNPSNYLQPWHFRDQDGRLDITFTPDKERVARTNLGIIFSEVHQLFGRYNGVVISNQGEEIHIADLIGFAEEHHARW